MVHKKTSHYTFITPVVTGAIVARAGDEALARLRRFSTALGTAFQIQDDVLNLSGDEAQIGKEVDGDLWEGKHTLILLHAVRTCRESERRTATQILKKRRPIDASATDRMMPLRQFVDRLRADWGISNEGAAALEALIERVSVAEPCKTAEDIHFLRDLVRRQKSVAYARTLAERRARFASRAFASMSRGWPASVHKDFLHDLTDFVVNRDH